MLGNSCLTRILFSLLSLSFVAKFIPYSWDTGGRKWKKEEVYSSLFLCFRRTSSPLPLFLVLWSVYFRRFFYFWVLRSFSFSFSLSLHLNMILEAISSLVQPRLQKIASDSFFSDAGGKKSGNEKTGDLEAETAEKEHPRQDSKRKTEREREQWDERKGREGKDPLQLLTTLLLISSDASVMMWFPAGRTLICFSMKNRKERIGGRGENWI